MFAGFDWFCAAAALTAGAGVLLYRQSRRIHNEAVQEVYANIFDEKLFITIAAAGGTVSRLVKDSIELKA